MFEKTPGNYETLDTKNSLASFRRVTIHYILLGAISTVKPKSAMLGSNKKTFFSYISWLHKSGI